MPGEATCPVIVRKTGAALRTPALCRGIGGGWAVIQPQHRLDPLVHLDKGFVGQLRIIVEDQLNPIHHGPRQHRDILQPADDFVPIETKRALA